MTLSLVIIDQVDPERLAPGGTDTCVHDFVKYADEGTVGIVGVTASKRPLGVWTEVQLAGKSTPFLPVARLDRSRKTGIRIPESLRLAIGLLKFWRRIPKTILQVHRVETGALVRLLGSRSYVQFLHNDASGLTGSTSDSVWRYLPSLYGWLERVSLRSASASILFSVGDSDRVRALAPSVQAVETWFDPEVFVERSGCWQAEGPLHVCFIGRLEAQKDPLLAARAFAHLHSIYPLARLQIVGEGSMRSAMEREFDLLGVREFVTFDGALSLAEVSAVMRRSDVLLMSSHYEGSPRVIAEAGASGLPIACTMESDPDNVVLDGISGKRVIVRSAAALGSAVLEAATCNRGACAEAVAHRSAERLIPKMLNAGFGKVV